MAENYGGNYLTVLGNQEQLADFKQKHLQNNEFPYVFTFNTILPVPLDLDQEAQLAWKSENWESEIDAQLCKVIIANGYIQIDYDTHFQPSRNVILVLSQQMPLLQFELEFQDAQERMECKYTYQNGIETEIYYYDPEYDEEDDEQDEQQQFENESDQGSNLDTNGNSNSENLSEQGSDFEFE